jgi:hypothetical protein
MADHPELLPRPESASQGPRRCSSGWFLSLSLYVAGAKTLIDKIASNQSWRGDKQPAHPRGVHQIDSVDMLAVEMDLLTKKLESPHMEANQVSESRMTCETCGETGHSGMSCPLTQEDANFVGTNNNNPNSGFRPQQGWNSKPNLPFGNQQGMNFNNFRPSLKDLVYGNQKFPQKRTLMR